MAYAKELAWPLPRRANRVLTAGQALHLRAERTFLSLVQTIGQFVFLSVLVSAGADGRDQLGLATANIRR